MEFKDCLHYKHLGFYFHMLSRQHLNAMVAEMSPWKMERAFLPLMVIAKNSGKINQNDLTHMLYLDKVSTNRIISYLSDSGWIIKKICPADKRKTLLEITPEGLDLIPSIQKSIAEVNKQFTGILSEAEQKQLFNLLEKIAINIEDQR